MLTDVEQVVQEVPAMTELVIIESDVPSGRIAEWREMLAELRAEQCSFQVFVKRWLLMMLIDAVTFGYLTARMQLTALGETVYQHQPGPPKGGWVAIPEDWLFGFPNQSSDGGRNG